MSLKDKLRKVALKLPFAITRNIAIDQATFKIMKDILKPSSNCIDVGCHKGEIMDVILKYAPSGTHFGFEPIPYLNKNLHSKYGSKVKIYNYALADFEGTSTFNLVDSNPAYSGLKKRKYDKVEQDSKIEVSVKKLDDVIAHDIKIDLIKIDTEGAEYQVLQGARKLIEKNKPAIIFEFGIGGSDIYGTTPDMMFAYFESLAMKIYVINKQFNAHTKSVSLQEFNKIFEDNIDYLFLAK